MSSAPLATDVVASATYVFRANKGWADQAISQTSDTNLRTSLDGHTNSIAVIMKHVAGNLRSRWTDLLTSDGEKAWRNRDDEFVDTFSHREPLLKYWEQGWDCLFSALAGLQAEDLLKTVTIRGKPHTVPLAIDRSLAHCGYHVGQIILLARHFAKDDWQTITIPRGGSRVYNDDVWGKGDSFSRDLR